MTIDEYFIKTERVISDFDIVIKQKIEKKSTGDDFGIFKGTLFFDFGKLDFIEVMRIVSESPIKIKYKYHFLNGNNEMIFRYDNVKHHPGISNFPHHKHTKEGIYPSNEPNFLTILTEIHKTQ